jgi:hypothetical protein
LDAPLGEKTYEVIRGKLGPRLEEANYERSFSGIDLGVIEYVWWWCGAIEDVKLHREMICLPSQGNGMFPSIYH